MKKFLFILAAALFLTCPHYCEAGTFKVTKDKYRLSEDLDSIIDQRFGEQYRMADWNDIKEEIANGMNPDQILGTNTEKDSAWCTRNGVKFGRSGMHYLVSRNNHNPHSGYYAHDNIDNHLFSLGSWNNPYKILAYCESCSESSGSNPTPDEKPYLLFNQDLDLSVPAVKVGNAFYTFKLEYVGGIANDPGSHYWTILPQTFKQTQKPENVFIRIGNDLDFRISTASLLEICIAFNLDFVEDHNKKSELLWRLVPDTLRIVDEATPIAATNTSPTARVSMSQTTGQSPVTFQMDGSGSSDSDGRIVSYVWKSSTGQTARGISASMTIDRPGTHRITLTVTDDEGATDSKSMSVSVEAASSSDIDVTGSWNYSASYRGCGNKATGQFSITRNSYKYSGQDWHHDCRVSGGYIETGPLDLKVPTDKEGFQEAVQGVYNSYYGPGTFDVRVVSFGPTRIDLEYHDNRDGSVELMTLTRNP